MKILVLIVLFGFVSGIRSQCLPIFETNAEECGKTYGVTIEELIIDYATGNYNVNNDDDSYAKYHKVTDCLWKKWGFVNSYGDIDYEKLQQDSNIPWRLAAVCGDVVGKDDHHRTALIKAMEDCQNEAPSHAPAEAVRRCIVKNHKQYL